MEISIIEQQSWSGNSLELKDIFYYAATFSKLKCLKKNKKIEFSTDVPHVNGKSNKDVEAIAVRRSQLNFIPSNLNQLFANLAALEIINCGNNRLNWKSYRSITTK